jgi:hypothetical protein
MIDAGHTAARLHLSLGTWRLLVHNIDPSRSQLTRRTRTLYWLNSAIQSLLHQIQKKSVADQLANLVVPAPIFVLGFWRSGTTLLHELLCCDDRYGFPSTYACLNPTHFLLSERWTASHFDRAVARPMDDVRYSWASPQEDEFALLALGAPSAYRALIVPSLMLDANRLLDLDAQTGEDQELWSKTFEYFLKLLTLQQRKTMILKSPTHGYRMQTLQKRFPDARYVLIERNPYEVFASNLKLWRTLTSRYGLEDHSEKQLEEFVLSAYVLHQKAVSEGIRHCASGFITQVRYEELVETPMEQISRVYASLRLGDFSEARARLEGHLRKVSAHQRNRFRLTRSQKEQIDATWGDIIQERGYSWPISHVEVCDT